MNRTTLAVIAALFAGAAHAQTTEFIIYKQPDFRGASQVVKGEVANLEGGFAREASSLVARGGFWEVCSDDHFKGRCRVIEPGEYPRLPGHWDDRIVSVRFVGTDPKIGERVAREDRRGDRREARDERRDERREARRMTGSVDLYGQQRFRGRAVRVEGSTASLAPRFDGRASSAIVNEGTWQFCTEPDFKGSCREFRPGEYPQLGRFDDRVASLRQVN